MPRPLLLLWFLYICLRFFAGLQIYKSGLLNKMPVIFCWLCVGSITSLTLFLIQIFAPYGTSSSMYAGTYSITCSIVTLLQTGCVVELFFNLSRYFRNFRKAGAILLCVLWAFAVLSTWAFRLAWVPADWTATWQIVMLGSRYADLAMAAVLVLALIILRFPAIVIPTSAWRMSLIIIGNAVYSFIVSSIDIGTENRQRILRALLPLLGGCLTAAATVLFVARKHVEEEVVIVAPPVSREELDRMEMEAMTRYYLLKGAARSALRRLIE